MSLKLKKVLISDNVDKRCAEILIGNGIEVVSKQKLPEEELIQELATCDGLIVRSETKVTEKVIKASNKLKIIGRAGTGVDNINLVEATRNGIIVLNAPTGNSISACELTCSVITCLARNVPAGCQSMKEGRWDRKLYSDGNELSDQTLGIVGLGRIGKEVAIRMKAFGMQVVGFDPIVTEEEAALHSIIKISLEELWTIADYITVHTPLIPQTKNLLNENVFNKCKRGVKIINVARGGIVSEQDLLNALKSGQCGGAALDVFSEEPPKSSVLKELILHPKVIATPHLGASTVEAQIRVAVEVAQQFSSLSNINLKYPVTGIVNAPALLASLKLQNTAWINLAEQLGKVISLITKEISIKGSKIQIALIGQDIKDKKFLSSSVLVGILSKNNQNGYNLINSSLHAKEAGLEVSFTEHTEQQEENGNLIRNILKVTLCNTELEYTVEGTVIEDRSYLLKVNDSSFLPASVQLEGNLQLFSCNAPEQIQSITNAVFQGNDKVLNISVAYGKIFWIVVQFEKNS